MNSILRKFADTVEHAIADAKVELDAPAEAAGNWFIDVGSGRRRVSLEFRPGSGFAIFSKSAEFGEGPMEIYRTPDRAARRVIQLLTASKPKGAINLKNLRDLYELTQEDLAKKIGIKQAAISRFESRREVKLGTLSEAVKAIGGRLEIRARFKDADIPLSLKS